MKRKWVKEEEPFQKVLAALSTLAKTEIIYPKNVVV